MKPISATTLAAGLLLYMSLAAASTPSWQWANPSPQGNNLYASVTGGTTSVAVGGNGTIYSNASGTWAQQTSPTTNDLRGVTFGNNLFVAVGLADTILHSSDGVTWTAATVSDTSQNLSSVVFGNSTFVAAGSNGTVFTSSDGVNWSENTILKVKTITNVTFGAGVFVAVARGTTTATVMFWSANGISWTQGTVPSQPTDPPFFVAWNGTEFVSIGANANNTGASLLTSTDGKTWTIETSPLSPTTAFPLSLTVSGSDFVVMLQSAQVQGTTSTPIILETSPDGTTWTQQAVNNLPAGWSQNIPLQISCTGSTCLVVGASAYIGTSSNFTSWTPESPATAATYNRLRGVHWFNNRYYAVGDADTILTSPDGITWTNENIAVTPTSNLRDIAYNGTRYVVVGSNGVVLTSSDGSTWSASTITPAVPSGTVFQGLVWNGSEFVAVANGGVIYTSPDGFTWTSQASGTLDNLGGVVWTGANFVAVSDNRAGDGKLILTSSDGVHWTSVPFNTGHPTSLYGIHMDGDTLIVAGSATPNSLASPVAIIGTSSDGGSTWTVDSSSISDTFSDAMLTGSNAYAALGLFNGNIYTSADGKNWVIQPPTVQNPMQTLAANCGVRIATGFAGVILSNITQPPTVTNGQISTPENIAVNGSLQSQACGGSLSFQISTQPQHGMVILTDATTGAFSYTPANGFSGADSFTFTATNSTGVSVPAAETITVNTAGGTPPTAQNGSVTTTEGTAVSGKLQATGSATSFSIKTNPAHGTVTLISAPIGSFTYTPASGFTGTDSFTFTASNSSGTSAPATETITVNAPGGGGGGGGGGGSSGGGSSGGGGGGALGVLSLLLLAGLGILRRK